MTNELKSFPAYTFKKDLVTLLVLLVICLLSFWPLTFHVFSLKNDAINYFLPVRHLITESFNHGYFPYWSPYFNLGYPLHADMQSGVWNPVVQLFSLFGSYTLYTEQIETLLYIYLGGMGMYFLLRHFTIHPLINLMCATAYMLCGFNSDSGQFLTWTGSSAFIPFVLLFYFRLLQHPSFYHAAVFSFFLWLSFAIGYPGLFIITGYILVAMFAAKIYTTPKETRLQYLKKAAPWNVVAILIFISLALPAILSYTTFLPLSERGSTVSYQDAMSNPLHPLLLIAYLAPLSVFDSAKFIITDGVERNSFFGIFTFIFFIAAFFAKGKQQLITFCKYAFVICLIFSFGEYGLLRKIAFYTLPLMKSFRHPAIAKIFCIFFGIIMAAFYLQKQTESTKSQKKHRQVLWVITVVMAGLAIWALVNSGNLFNIAQQIRNTAGNTKAVLLQSKTSLSFYNLLLISLLIQAPFLWFFYRYAVTKFNLKAIAVTSIMNCIVHALIFTFFTIVKKDSGQKIQSIIAANRVNGYPYPSLNTSLYDNSKDGLKYFNEIGSLNLYNKKIGRSDFIICPSNVQVQNQFWGNVGLRNIIMQYPFFYQPDTAFLLTNTPPLPTTSPQKIVFVEDSFQLNRINQQSKNKADVAITHFTPNAFHFTYNATGNAFLVLCQNRYPFWKASIDGQPATIIPVNTSFMGVAIPAGKHSLHFDFKSHLISASYIFSVAVALSLIIYFAFVITHNFRRKNSIQ